MLTQQRPSAPRPPVHTDAVVARPRPQHAPVPPPRQPQTLNARGDLSRAGKVRSPVV